MTFSSLLRSFFYPLIFLLTVLAAAALSAPWITKISHGFINLTTTLGRGAMLGLAVSFIPLARQWKLDGRSLGLCNYRKIPAQIVVGLVAGILTMGAHALLLHKLTIRLVMIPDTVTSASIMHRMMGNIGIGMAIGTVEELLFRGMLYAAVKRFHGDTMAILVSAFYFTLPHFLSTQRVIQVDDIEWDSGLILLGSAFHHLLISMDASSAAALFSCGLLLGCMRYRFPAGLGYCIGIHAGWVAILKTYKPISVHVPEVYSHLYWTVGDYDHVIGWFSALWSLPLALAIAFAARKQ